MQQIKPKLIGPAEYARSRHLNRSTVSRQIRDDKIPTVGGLIDPAAADRARELNLNQTRRAEAQRRKQKAGRVPDRAPEAVQVSDYETGWRVGRADEAHRICRSVRTALAELLAGAQFESLSPEEALVRRVSPLALMTYLTEAWMEDQLSDAKALGMGPLPAIAWRRLFGSAAREAKACFEELRAYWGTGGDTPMPEVQTGKTKALAQRRRAAKRSK